MPYRVVYDPSWAAVRRVTAPERVRIVCRGESVEHERRPFGGKVVRYIHYLSEFATKSQAVRQVAAELLAEYSRELRMPALLREYEGLARQVNDGGRVYEDFLFDVDRTTDFLSAGRPPLSLTSTRTEVSCSR